MSKLVIISISIFISVIISVFLIRKNKQTIEKNEVNDISKPEFEPGLEPESEVMIRVPESPPEVPIVSPNVIAPIVKDEEIVPEVLPKIPEDIVFVKEEVKSREPVTCLLYTSPSPRDRQKSRMPSSA